MFEWKPLGETWKSKLLTDKFFIKNCLGDGNCQFRSIETALVDAGLRTSHDKLRRVIATYIRKMSKSEFMDIIGHYRLEKETGEFVGKWDPLTVKHKKDFIDIITTPGFTFQGDNLTLALLSKALKIDFILFDNKYNITDLSNTDEPQNRIIILYYEKMSSSGHYQTIGLKTPRKMKTLFTREKLPVEVEILLNKNKFFLRHISEIYTELKKRTTLNKTISRLQSSMVTELSKGERKLVMKILKTVLENDRFFVK
jgi:hypothetical protein